MDDEVDCSSTDCITKKEHFILNETIISLEEVLHGMTTSKNKPRSEALSS